MRRLLDLYCGEGGAGVGYARAGFAVYGVDLNDDWLDRHTRPRPLPLKRYPFRSVAGDVVAVLTGLLAGESVGFTLGERSTRLSLEDFTAIHASPPCQLHSSISRLAGHGNREHHVELIAPTRALLEATGLPWVIENVEHSPLLDPMKLCGSMFDPPLDVQRHRLFESNWPLEAPQVCRHDVWTPRFQSADYRGRRSGKLMRVVPVYGGTRYPGDIDLRRKVMEMPWASNQGVTQAIPPAYSEWIGTQLIEHLAVA